MREKASAGAVQSLVLRLGEELHFQTMVVNSETLHNLPVRELSQLQRFQRRTLRKTSTSTSRNLP